MHWRSDPTHYITNPALAIREPAEVNNSAAIGAQAGGHSRGCADLQFGAQAEPSEGEGPSAQDPADVFMAGLDDNQLAHLRNWLAGMAGVSKPDCLVSEGAYMEQDVLEAVRAKVKPASASHQVGKNPKPPAPPYFSGKNVTAKELRGWLSMMKLQWAQLKPHDETLFALMYLSEDAALWRDVQFTQAHGGTTGIPTAVFEAELVQQFIPMTVALQADRDFAQIW